MNDFDRENLDWLMNASREELAEFYDQADTEDLMYLLRLVRFELSKLQLEDLELTDEVEDTTQAKNILQKFRLKV